VLYGRALVQQQRLKLPLLNVIERVEHHSKKLRKEEMRENQVLIHILCSYLSKSSSKRQEHSVQRGKERRCCKRNLPAEAEQR